ncbi:MAG: tripartite tricarboxylate transporter substrate binding protein [Rhodoferax sp.]|nr:tripartite tricarboxylate transporter substrate binding protein [Rhodoferax sp.]
MFQRRTLCTVIGAAALHFAAHAQIGGQPLSFVVPFSPGGGSDLTARQMSGRLGQELQRTVVVENRPGANGAIAAVHVARSKPDGNTIMIGSGGTFVINPLLIKSTPYQMARDFELLTLAVRTANVVVVPASLPVRNISELLAYVKANEGKVTFGSAGNGSTEHLSAALVWKQAGAPGIHVAYKGASPAVADLLAGHINVLITNVPLVAQHIKAGKIKALALTGETRSPALPDVPTVSEEGYKDLVAYSWQAVVAPKGLPQDAARKLEAALVATLKDPEVKKNLAAQGFEVVGSSAADLARTMAGETARWKSVIEGANITVD